MIKNILIIFVVSLFSASIYGQMSGALEGNIADSTTKEGLIGASITIYKAGSTQAFTGTQTDIEGNYSIMGLAYGFYDVEFSYVGYRKQKIEKVMIASKVEKLNTKLLEGGNEFNYYQPIRYYCPPPIIQLHNTTQGRTFKASEIEKSPIKW